MTATGLARRAAPAYTAVPMSTADPAFLGQLFGLDGRVALVTGASSGIGRAIAEGYARAGATVALNGRDQARLADVERAIAEAGGAAAAFPAELRDLGAIERLVAGVVE